jgi:hypothetical protein
MIQLSLNESGGPGFTTSLFTFHAAIFVCNYKVSCVNKDRIRSSSKPLSPHLGLLHGHFTDPVRTYARAKRESLVRITYFVLRFPSRSNL